MSKVLKSKEKEINSLETKSKTENQFLTIKNLKEQTNKFKNGNSKLLRALKKIDVKRIQIENKKKASSDILSKPSDDSDLNANENKVRF